ncbi:hypothetical protein AAVH_31006 [Aphelenchoides avenae]|nr:hypothetical protein AAVH_31006 [Aphelenchus avenae]
MWRALPRCTPPAGLCQRAYHSEPSGAHSFPLIAYRMEELQQMHQATRKMSSHGHGGNFPQVAESSSFPLIAYREEELRRMYDTVQAVASAEDTSQPQPRQMSLADLITGFNHLTPTDVPGVASEEASSVPLVKHSMNLR